VNPRENSSIYPLVDSPANVRRPIRALGSRVTLLVADTAGTLKDTRLMALGFCVIRETQEEARLE
jgi:hypothetical protein